MSAVRPIFTSLLAFALLGIGLATYIGPMKISSDMCGDSLTSRPCQATIDEATSRLLRYQGYGAAGGSVIGLIVGIAFIAGRTKKPAPVPAPAPTPPPQAKPPI